MAEQATEKRKERKVEYFNRGKVYEAMPFADFFASPTDLLKRGDKVDGNNRERNIFAEKEGLVMTVDRVMPIVTLEVYGEKENPEELIGVLKVFGVPAKYFKTDKETLENLKGQNIDTELIFGEELKKSKAEKELKGKELIKERTLYALIGGHNVENGRRIYKHIGSFLNLPSAASYFPTLPVEVKEAIKALSRIVNAGEKTYKNEEYIAKVEESIGKVAEKNEELGQKLSQIHQKALSGGEEFKEAQKEAMNLLLTLEGEAIAKEIKQGYTVGVEMGEDEFVKIRENRSGLRIDIEPEELLGKEVTFVTIPEVDPKEKRVTGYDRIISVKENGKEVLGEEGSLYYKGTKQLWDTLTLAKIATYMQNKEGKYEKDGQKLNFEYGKSRLEEFLKELEENTVSKMYQPAYEALKEIARTLLQAESPEDVRKILYTTVGEGEEAKRVPTYIGELVNRAYRARDFISKVRKGEIKRAQYLDFMDRLARKMEFYEKTKAVEPEITPAPKRDTKAEVLNRKTRVADMTQEEAPKPQENKAEKQATETAKAEATKESTKEATKEKKATKSKKKKKSTGPKK